MTADYLSLVEKRLGMKFQRVKNLSWQEAYARMKRWEVDMTTTVAVSPERETFWAFTKPYMTIPIVIVTRSDVAYIADLRELEGKKVVVVAGSGRGADTAIVAAASTSTHLFDLHINTFLLYPNPPSTP